MRFVAVTIILAIVVVPAILVGGLGALMWRSAVEAQVGRGQQVAATTATLLSVARESGSAADLAVARAFVRAVISDDVEAVVASDAAGAVITAAHSARYPDPATALSTMTSSSARGVVVDAELQERDRATQATVAVGRVQVGLRQPAVPARLIAGSAVIAVALAIAVALLVITLLRQRALQPLSAVTRGLTAVATGNSADIDVHDVRRPGQRPLREIEALLDAFDALVLAVADRTRLSTRLEQGMGAQVARDAEALERAPQQQPVAVVVIDVRDFTALQASLSPELAVAFVDRMLKTFVAVVERHGGHVERFLGDGLIALFGAPQPAADYIERAAACAVDLEVAARHLIATERDNGVPRFVVGVGVAAGTATVGAVGPASRRSFAAMGEVPALARKVQQEAKNQGLTVLVTADVYAVAKDTLSNVTWKKLPPMVVRGVGVPVTLYRPERTVRKNDDVTALVGASRRP